MSTTLSHVAVSGSCAFAHEWVVPSIAPLSPVEAKILRSDGMVDGMRPRVSRVVFELKNFPFGVYYPNDS